MFKRILSLLFAILILAGVGIVSFSAENTEEYSVLFTHDLHSHFLPTLGESGEYEGGYARIMTKMEEVRKKYPQTVTLDGGDFSMGSLFQTGFATHALELCLMGKMGYDVTTLGNHEFDYLPEGLSAMLTTAKKSGGKVPEVVEANYVADSDTDDCKKLREAFELYTVKEYTVIEREGLYYAVFGIFGEASHLVAPNSGMTLLDNIEIAQKTVDAAVKECKEKYGKEPLVVCLSHSGTENGAGEDVELAKGVKGIDLIVSAHSHSTTEEPIKVNDTYVVSCGNYGRSLGSVRLKMSGDKAEITSFELIDINESVEENGEIAKVIEEYKDSINKTYLAPYGLTFDTVLLENEYEFESVEDIYATQHESPLGNLLSDAYKWAAEKETGLPVDLAVTASGVIRETIPKGEVTVSNIFDTASLGVGTEGEIVMVYVTGKDLRTILEVDATASLIMPAAQLFTSGVRYSFNVCRMLFNRVDSAELVSCDGKTAEIEDEKLYRIVTGMYIGQMLGQIEDKAFGLISVTPRDENGNPIEAEDLVNYVVKDKNGNPLKEWYAISAYMQSMGGRMSEKYSAADGRKNVYFSLSPIDLLKNANIFTFIAMGVILLLLSLIATAVVLIVRKVKKAKRLRKTLKAPEIN